MGYSHLLSTEAALANFRVVFDIPEDVDIATVIRVTSLFSDALVLM